MLLSYELRTRLVAEIATIVGAGPLRILISDHFDGQTLDTIASTAGNDAERVRAVLDWAEQGGRDRLWPLLSAIGDEFGGVLALVTEALSHLDCVAPSFDRAMATRRPSGQPFVDRENHKHYVTMNLKRPDEPYRVVLLWGDADAGKSFLWKYLSFVAKSLHVDAIKIDLEREQNPSARDLFHRITDEASAPAPPEVHVDGNATPATQARTLVGKLVGWAKEAAHAHHRPLWILIDHVDKIPLQEGPWNFILHLADAAVDRKVDGLRLFLVGVPRSKIPAWLEGEHRPMVIDELTEDDLVAWLELEVGPPAPELTQDQWREKVREKAREVLEGEHKRQRHRYLADAVDRLRQLALGGGQ